jgi:hypothetical protein
MPYLKPFISVSFLALLMVFSAGCSKKEGVSTELDQLVVQQESPSSTGLEQMEVYKSPTCGCCSVWVDHMSAAGFNMNAHDLDNLQPVKQSHGISRETQSCHTAVSKEGFVFEGHVPAKFVKRFLAEKPNDARGLAVPAMPVGTPGMEMGDKFMPYQVLLLKTDGSTEVYAQVSQAEQQY